MKNDEIIYTETVFACKAQVLRLNIPKFKLNFVKIHLRM